jgi:beta-glucosidase
MPVPFSSRMTFFVRALAVALGVSLALAVSPVSAGASCGAHPWCDASISVQKRASLVLGAMKAAEKLEVVANGSSGDARLGIPAIRFVDGPNGVGEGSTHVTAFPDAQTIAASWDRGLAEAYGRALGAEAFGKGDTLIAAPTVNIVRTALWGREPETLGEDPFLAGTLAAPEIRGIQSQHVISQVKHFAGNDQEIDRFGQPLGAAAVSDQVSRRALQEIYFAPFRAAVQQGHVASVMCAYNRINLIYSCQDPETLRALKSFGLRGFVGPDAELAVRDDVAAVNAGVDNMQLGSIATATGASELAILTKAYNQGQISIARLNDAARRILTAMFQVGQSNHRPTGGPSSRVSTREHLALATRVAEDATVLLKNRRGVLPLRPRAGSIAVIGHDAGEGTQTEENGSPAVRPGGPVISPLSGIRRMVGHRSRITYAPGTLGVVPLATIPTSALAPSSGTGHGLSATLYSGQSPSGTPLVTRIDPTVNFASTPTPLTPIPNADGATAGQWTGTLTPPKSGLYRFSLKTAGVARLYLNGHLVVSANAEFASAAGGGFINDPGGPTITFQGQARLSRSHPVSIRVTYATGSSIPGAALQVGWAPPQPSLLSRAVNAARHAKAAVVFANDVSSEGMDRPSFTLPGDQDRLINAVAAVNPRTIVVLHTAGPVLMPWLSKVAAVLEAWYPGQQSGAAIAATLFGKADPSGHLPVTFPRSARQGPATTKAEYPGVNALSQYSEGVFVGYRYYEQHHQRPLFPFGFGLSYTRFALSHLKLERSRQNAHRATVRLSNTGHRAGAEVVQAYVQFPAVAGEPPRQLKAYRRVLLEPRTSRTVRLDLPRSSFEYYNARRNQWMTAAGRYRVYVGTSSSVLPFSASINVR